jgi:regulatory protein
MHNKRVYNVSIAIERIKNYCALQDRCQWDVLEKMREWGLQQATKDHILEILINEKFVDEERFASSFCRGKFRIKNWGNDYNQVLGKLFHQKNATLKDKNHFTRKTKIANFLTQRGFESNLVWDKIRELSDK